jgi:hypothetical protein
MWIDEWLREGVLAATARSAFLRLPRRGTHRIRELLRP